MTNLTDAAALANSEDFKQLLAAQLERSALEIYNEDPMTDGHEPRAQLALRLLLSPADPYLLSVFAWGVSTDVEIVTDWADDDRDAVASALADVILSVWDSIADAKGAAPTL